MFAVRCYQIPLKTAVKEIFSVNYKALCRSDAIEKIYFTVVF